MQKYYLYGTFKHFGTIFYTIFQKRTILVYRITVHLADFKEVLNLFKMVLNYIYRKKQQNMYRLLLVFIIPFLCFSQEAVAPDYIKSIQCKSAKENLFSAIVPLGNEIKISFQRLSLWATKFICPLMTYKPMKRIIITKLNIATSIGNRPI